MDFSFAKAQHGWILIPLQIIEGLFWLAPVRSCAYCSIVEAHRYDDLRLMERQNTTFPG